LKIIEGIGGFFDYDKIISLALPGIGKKAMNQFKNWCFQNRFSLAEGFNKANRFPIPGLAAAKQQMINEVSKQLLQLNTELAPLAVTDKLQYISQHTVLSGMLNNDRKIQEALDALIVFAGQFQSRTDDFLAAVALHTDTDAYLSQVEKVSLMTMHAAKGLEFPVVFIAGCEQDLIPYQKSDSTPADIHEERRLFYVAMTRAMERLYLTRAVKRRIYGRQCDRTLSVFVADIEAQLKTDESPRIRQKKTDKPQQVQLKLF
jgi:superfamily I DNA/RNA helicase